MRRARSLVAFGLVLLFAFPAGANQQPDLVSAFAEELGLSWETAPESVATDDGTNDLFLLEGESTTGEPQVDILRTEQFAFTIDDALMGELFGDSGALACDLPEVSCPPYEVDVGPFAEGVFVVAVQLGGSPEPPAEGAFTVAVLAFDDDWPTFTDPRPNSPFVGTNKAWRFDLSATSDSVRFLQVVTGPYEEFQTDARVLVSGQVVWFVIPGTEMPLAGTIVFLRGHTFLDPAADVDGEGAAPAELVPVGPTGELTVAQATTTSAAPVTTTTASPVTTAAATTTEALPVPTTGGVSPLVFVVAALVLVALLVIFLRPKRKCEKEYEAWQAAQAACDAANAAVSRARAEAENLRSQLDQLRQDYPPLAFDESDEPTIEMEDGDTMSALDMALTSWDDKTRQPPVALGPGGSRADAAAAAGAQREQLREEYQEMKAREADLLAKLATAEAAARAAEARAREACAAAEAAHQAYLRCMGQAVPPAVSAPPPPDEPEPAPPTPEPPTPAPPTPEPPPPAPPAPVPPAPSPPGPPPEEPKPPTPTPPTPSPGGSEEFTPQCEEGAQREADLRTATFEMLRDRGRATIRISNDLTDDVEEFHDHAMGAINEATRWAAARARIKGQEGVLYTIHITIQMERVHARCYTPEVCRNGRWVLMSYKTREVSEPEYFEKTIQRENLDHRTLRHVLQTARNMAGGGGREELDRFCR